MDSMMMDTLDSMRGTMSNIMDSVNTLGDGMGAMRDNTDKMPTTGATNAAATKAAEKAAETAAAIRDACNEHRLFCWSPTEPARKLTHFESTLIETVVLSLVTILLWHLAGYLLDVFGLHSKPRRARTDYYEDLHPEERDPGFPGPEENAEVRRGGY
ncbi:hypothetical protein GGR53DRAFT_418315 [Hypoxylon sp. FL1150]|nr:hypothetical protein GGR53DRAFT_418315 [Hypoxylon sp. FL1150]